MSFEGTEALMTIPRVVVSSENRSTNLSLFRIRSCADFESSKLYCTIPNLYVSSNSSHHAIELRVGDFVGTPIPAGAKPNSAPKILLSCFRVTVENHKVDYRTSTYPKSLHNRRIRLDCNPDGKPETQFTKLDIYRPPTMSTWGEYFRVTTFVLSLDLTPPCNSAN
jgi:hypothetical protein